MPARLSSLVLAGILGGVCAGGARAEFLVYPDGDTSFNPRVACIPPVDRSGGGKCLEAEAEFRYQLAPFVTFADGGQWSADIRDNGRREAKEIVALEDGAEKLVLRVAKAADGGGAALVLTKNGKDQASAPLAKPLPRDWSSVSVQWNATGATVTCGDGDTARLAWPAPLHPRSVMLETAQVAGLKIGGQGTFALDWTDGYAAQVAPTSVAAPAVRLLGFDTFVISQDHARRDCPMVEVLNGSPGAQTITFTCELAGENAASHQQWTQDVAVPPGSSVTSELKLPAPLASDVYHLAVRSNSVTPTFIETKNFLFVEDRREPAGPDKFGLHDSARHYFGCWPDALPVSLSTNYVSWGVVMGPPWVKDPGMNADTPPDQWNWNARVDWAVGQGLTTWICLGSTPFADWQRERAYDATKMRKAGWGATGGFPKLDLYRKFVRELATRYKGRVHYYEVENEPMAQAGIPPEDYVQIAKAVSEEVHAVDPTAKVFGICGTGDFVSWMKKMFDLGGAQVLDGVSIHTYVTPNMPEQAGLPAKLAEVSAIIAKSGKPMPVVNSETGTFIALREVIDHPLSPEHLTELIKSGTPNLSVKAGWPFRAIDERSAGTSVVRNAVYNFLAKADYFTFFGYNPAWPPANWSTGASLFSGEHGVDDACWAMISATKDGERTPSLFTLAVGELTEQLKGADQHRAQAVNGEGLLGAIFPKADGGEVAVLWSPLGRRSALLQANDPTLEVVSMLGTKQTLSAPAGKFRVELGEEPVYIHARHPGLKLLPSPVVAIAQDFSSGSHGFRFTVVNTSEQRWKSSVELASPAGWQAALESPDFSLAPGERIVLSGSCTLPADMPKGSYALNAAMKLPDGTPFTFPISIDVRPSVTISNVTSDFAWDQMASWAQVGPALKIDQAAQVVVGRPPPLASLQEEKYWAGPQELSAEVRLAASPDALLIYLEAQDANFKLPAAWPGVAGSCVELFLDGRSSAAGLGHSNYGPGVGQILIKPPDGVQQALALANTTGKLSNVSAIGARLDDGKYWIAVRVPWKSLGSRTPGQPLGFDIGLDGASHDGLRRKSQMMLFGSAANNTDASAFGLVQLTVNSDKVGIR